MKTLLQILTVVSLLTVLAALSGCATTETIAGPDGEPAQLITCGAIKLCYQKATEVCGKYKILNTTSEFSGEHSSGTSQIHLLVKCEH